MDLLTNFYKPTEPQNTDTDLLLGADFHVGSTTAIFPNMVREIKDGVRQDKWIPLEQTGGWYFTHNNNFYPSALQKDIFNHYDQSLDLINTWRHGERLIIIKNGDLIDGNHHGTHQLVTYVPSEQVSACVELIKYTKSRLGYREGIDKLFLTEGTESHVKKDEIDIAKQVNAEYYSLNEQVTPFIEMYINGTLLWVYHHGVKAGEYPYRGNALLNKLKKIRLQCLENGRQIPDVVITAHTHDPDHQILMVDYKEMHGIILPSQQAKTIYVNAVAPTAINRVGLQFMHITKHGDIEIPKPYLMALPSGHVVRL